MSFPRLGVTTWIGLGLVVIALVLFFFKLLKFRSLLRIVVLAAGSLANAEIDINELGEITNELANN